MPDLATLSGKFSSADGDVVESTGSVVLRQIHFVSPEEDFISTGFIIINIIHKLIPLPKPKKGTTTVVMQHKLYYQRTVNNCAADKNA